MLNITLQEYEDWLYFQKSYSKASIYPALYRKANTYFLHKKYTSNTCLDFMRILNDQVEKSIISRSTYNNYLKALKLLTRAQGYTFDIPLKVKKTERAYIVTLNDDEVMSILGYLFSVPKLYRYAVAYQVLVEHGIRFENLRLMTWENVKEDQVFINKTKMNKSYTLEISAELKEKIERLRGNHVVYVFGTKKGLLDRPKFNKRLSGIIVQLGINKYITSHKLRHTNATLLAARGVDIKTISENHGHRSIKSTEGYIHVNEKMKREATRKLGISKFTLVEAEIRKEAGKFVSYLNQGGCQAFVVPQNKNLVITVPL